jgi:tetratricopeptide (TPR) repeat protein
MKTIFLGALFFACINILYPQERPMGNTRDREDLLLLKPHTTYAEVVREFGRYDNINSSGTAIEYKLPGGRVAELVFWTEGDYFTLYESDLYALLEISPQGEMKIIFNLQKTRSDYERDVEDYSAAIELDPDNPENYYRRGRAYYNLGKYAEALSDFSKKLELDPDYKRAYIYRASVYMMLEWRATDPDQKNEYRKKEQEDRERSR